MKTHGSSIIIEENFGFVKETNFGNKAEISETEISYNIPVRDIILTANSPSIPLTPQAVRTEHDPPVPNNFPS